MELAQGNQIDVGEMYSASIPAIIHRIPAYFYSRLCMLQ